jgi:uncharacterized protein (DUF1778 family)
MNTLTKERKSSQLLVRMTPTQKLAIERAAALEGMTLSEYVTSQLNRAAKDSIQQREILALSARDSRLLADALLGPARVSGPALRRAAAAYRQESGA